MMGEETKIPTKTLLAMEAIVSCRPKPSLSCELSANAATDC